MASLKNKLTTYEPKNRSGMKMKKTLTPEPNSGMKMMVTKTPRKSGSAKAKKSTADSSLSGASAGANTGAVGQMKKSYLMESPLKKSYQMPQTRSTRSKTRQKLYK